MKVGRDTGLIFSTILKVEVTWCPGLNYGQKLSGEKRETALMPSFS